jgi:hypothetical protein
LADRFRDRIAREIVLREVEAGALRRREIASGTTRMEMKPPEFLRELCSAESIRPFSHYVRRTPWAIREETVARAFLGRMGVYCFWWSGRPATFLDRLARYTYMDEPYPLDTRPTFDHGLIPAYVGMTANAARRAGGKLEGRMVDRLVRFVIGMNYWLTSRKEARLVEPLTGMSNFNLFDYPERIRARLAAQLGKPELSVADAQNYLIDCPSECRDLIAEFDDDYRTLMFDNYSISFVPFANEADLFYAEALAIGALRPCLNHS